MDLCRIKNRDLDNYAQAHKHDYIKLLRTEEHLKDARSGASGLYPPYEELPFI